jgi:hypothetical protein
VTSLRLALTARALGEIFGFAAALVALLLVLSLSPRVRGRAWLGIGFGLLLLARVGRLGVPHWSGLRGNQWLQSVPGLLTAVGWLLLVVGLVGVARLAVSREQDTPVDPPDGKSQDGPTTSPEP